MPHHSRSSKKTKSSGNVKHSPDKEKSSSRGRKLSPDKENKSRGRNRSCSSSSSSSSCCREIDELRNRLESHQHEVNSFLTYNFSGGDSSQPSGGPARGGARSSKKCKSGQEEQQQTRIYNIIFPGTDQVGPVNSLSLITYLTVAEAPREVIRKVYHYEPKKCEKSEEDKYQCNCCDAKVHEHEPEPTSVRTEYVVCPDECQSEIIKQGTLTIKQNGEILAVCVVENEDVFIKTVDSFLTAPSASESIWNITVTSNDCRVKTHFDVLNIRTTSTTTPLV